MAVNATERAELLGMSLREYVAFAERNRDLFVDPIARTVGALLRIGRWHDAGEPQPDFSRLVYFGDAHVRRILVDTLARFPAAFGWHCVEFVTPWLETGRSTSAWATCAPLIRVPAGDTAHMIAISGAESDGRMPHVVAHEASHSWHMSLYSDERRVPLTADERLARALAVFDGDTLARMYLAEEILADATAAALGFTANGGHSSDHVRRRGFDDEIAAAKDRIAAINRGDEP